MKKISFLFLLFFPIFISATEINKIYINSEMDIAGNIIVKEIVEVDNYDKDLSFNIYYKDSEAMKFDGSKDSLVNSDIYNAYRIQINNIGIVKDNTDIEEMYKDNFVNKYVTLISDYQEKDEDGYLTINLNSKNKKTIYYLEYLVLGVSVKHNDCSELYYKYFDNFNYDVKNITIVSSLPTNSKLFEVWAHGNKNIKVTKDKNNSVVVSEIENYKKNTSFDLRLVFDRNIFSVQINTLKNSNINALDLIREVETERIKNTSNHLVLFYFLLIVSIILLLSLVSYLYFIKSKKCGILKTTEKLNMNLFVYHFVKFFGNIIYKILYFPRYYGVDNIPKEGPVILAGNHTHNLDAGFMIAAPKRTVRTVSKIELFSSKFKKWFFKSMGCISVDRSIHDKSTISNVMSCLENKEVIGIFPEGTVNKTENIILPFKYGAVSFAEKTGAYIVPFAITGKYKLFKKNVKINYGKPYKIKKNSNLDHENKKLMKIVKDMVIEGRKEYEKK